MFPAEALDASGQTLNHHDPSAPFWRQPAPVRREEVIDHRNGSERWRGVCFFLTILGYIPCLLPPLTTFFGDDEQTQTSSHTTQPIPFLSIQPASPLSSSPTRTRINPFPSPLQPPPSIHTTPTPTHKFHLYNPQRRTRTSTFGSSSSSMTSNSNSNSNSSSTSSLPLSHSHSTEPPPPHSPHQAHQIPTVPMLPKKNYQRSSVS